MGIPSHFLVKMDFYSDLTSQVGIKFRLDRSGRGFVPTRPGRNGLDGHSVSIAQDGVSV